MKQKVVMLLGFLLGISLLSALDMYGAFKIITTPKRADVTLYDIDLYLCSTPSEVYSVIEDEGMEIREGIPGRPITLMITKDGYVPLKKQIFVPLCYADQEYALDHPSVFSFELRRDRRHSYTTISYYYSYRNPRPRWHYHLWTPGFFPWCPPGFVFNPGGHNPPGGGHHGPGNPPGGGHHGDGDYPPGGGHHGGGDNPPGGGHHGDGDNPPGGGDDHPGTHYGTLFTTTPLNSDELNHKEKLPGTGGREDSPTIPGKDPAGDDSVIKPDREKPVIVIDKVRPDRPNDTNPVVKPDKKERSDDSKKASRAESVKKDEKSQNKDKAKTKDKKDDKKDEKKDEAKIDDKTKN